MKKIFLFLLCFIAALALWAAAPAANALAEEELSLSLSHAVSSTEKPVSGENFTLTFTADEGYSLSSSLTLVINGVSLEEDEYTFENGVLFVEGARVTGKVEITLQALPNENTPYTEKHYVEDAQGEVIYLETHYRLYSQEAKQGVTDTQVSAQGKEMEGYHLFAAPQTTVLGNGEGVAEAYYLVNEYALTAESCENGVIEILTPTVRHGETGVFRVLPSSYYHVEKVFVEGVEQTLREQYEIVITHNTQVSALFAGNYVQGVYANDVHAVYNGTAHGLTLQGLQDGDLVEYSTDGESFSLEPLTQTDAGEMEVFYRVTRDNYFPYLGSASVVVTPFSVTPPEPDQTQYVFNGSEIHYAIDNTEYYTASNGVRRNCGSQQVSVALTNKNNYVWSTGGTDDLLFDFSIAPLSVTAPTADERVFVYNGEAQEYLIAQNVWYHTEGNLRTQAGVYSVKVHLNEPDNLLWSTGGSQDLEFVFTIEKAVYNLEGVCFSGASFVRDGSVKSLSVSGELPAGVTLSYIGNDKTEVGIYTVEARFSGDGDNYEPIPSKYAEMHILFDRLSGEEDLCILSCEEGFDSRAHLMVRSLSPSIGEVLRLRSSQKVRAAVSVGFEKNGFEPQNVEYTLRLRVPSNAKNIKVYLISTEIKEMNYVIENGYITVKTGELGQIAVVSDSLSSGFLIFSAIFVAALVIIGVTFLVLSKKALKKAVEEREEGQEKEGEKAQENALPQTQEEAAVEEDPFEK